MWQKITGLRHQFDPKVIILNADMHMHATDKQSVNNRAQIACDGAIAFAFGMFLAVPLGKRMGRCRQQCHVELAGNFGQG